MNAPFYDDDEANLQPLAPEAWTVDSEDKAAWATDIILSHEERIERIKRQYLAMMLRAEKELARAREFFEPMLREWGAANLRKGERTVRLTTGSLSFRRKPGGVRVDDEAVCLAWAEKALPEAITHEVTRKLDVARAKKEGERLIGERVAALFQAIEVPTSQEEADQMMRNLIVAAAEALPPGMRRVEDIETFDIKGPQKKAST